MLEQKNGQDISEKMKQTGNKQILSDRKKGKKDSSNVQEKFAVVTNVVYLNTIVDVIQSNSKSKKTKILL